MNKALQAGGFLKTQTEEQDEEKHVLLIVFYARRDQWGFCKRCRPSVIPARLSDSKRPNSGIAAGHTDDEAQLLVASLTETFHSGHSLFPLVSATIMEIHQVTYVSRHGCMCT